MIKQITGWIFALLLLSGCVYSALYVTAIEHRRKQADACWLAYGNGEPVYKLGIPVDYHCMRMHLVLKYRNGVYK